MTIRVIVTRFVIRVLGARCRGARTHPFVVVVDVVEDLDGGESAPLRISRLGEQATGLFDVLLWSQRPRIADQAGWNEVSGRLLPGS